MHSRVQSSSQEDVQVVTSPRRLRSRIRTRVGLQRTRNVKSDFSTKVPQSTAEHPEADMHITSEAVECHVLTARMHFARHIMEM